MLLKRIGLLLVGLGIGLASVEIIARILWVAPWHERLIEEQQESERFEYKRNRFNLRDKEYDYPTPTGVKRILMLGDSFTFGQGVPENHKVFPEIIERALRTAPPPNAPEGVEIMNAGLPGSLTEQWLEVWDGLADVFDPDLVVVVFFLRDGTPNASVPEFFDRIRDEVAVANRQSRRYQYSYVYRLIRDLEDRKKVASMYTDRFRAAYHGAPHQTKEWQRARANLIRLQNEARARGIPTALVIFPVLVELNDPYPFQGVVDTIQQFADDNGFPTYDLLPDFKGQNAPNLWVSPFDQHPNAEAHKLVAEQLEPFVRMLIATTAERENDIRP